MPDSQSPRSGWPASLAEYIGWKDLGVRDGVYRSSIQVRPEHLAPNGFLQAAVVVALADITCGGGSFSTIPEGASFTTLVGDMQVNGEISYRENAPMADDGGSPRRDELLQAQIGFTQIFRPTALWDDLTIVGEIVGFEDVGKNNDEMAFDARAAGYALRADFAYKNVLQALDTNVLLFVQQGLHGTVREATLVEDAVVLSVGLRGTYLDRIVAELNYATYFGGGFDNWLIDRDNVAFNIKYSF